MYLSHLLIDIGHNPDRPRPARLWLRDIYRVHQRLSMAFPSQEQKEEDAHNLKPYKPQGYIQNRVVRSEQRGFLFRIDPRAGGNPSIIVQSAIEPDWDYAFHNVPEFLALEPSVKTQPPLPATDKPLAFMLLANPTTRSRETCKRLPATDFRAWLERVADRDGFELDAESLSMQLGYTRLFKPYWRRRSESKNGKDTDTAKSDRPESKGKGKGKNKPKAIGLRSVRYRGKLKVTDADKFVGVLAGGIGRAKGFGFGLMTVEEIPTE